MRTSAHHAVPAPVQEANKRPRPLVGLSQKGKGSTSPHPPLANRCSCRWAAHISELPCPPPGCMWTWPSGGCWV